ncbi:Protein of unknown function [Saccharopolyspora kobensis]|uniref:Minor tail T domain-containing protein n=1 Tax=Saccharopolyspora kobensis TaxID=146035 RepID=A0A1H6EPF8_9PSEU|nr:DUF4035 domain-containing protein [Saccharopolyspora kobensis]SEG98815.1 Protein of unknown function [Saccharopolyspora kobensis]SFD23193.1 Protein of unknown function [Saccharopolyspora kobensis]
MDSQELSEWAAFEMIEGPIGQRRDDILTAMQISAVVNANRDRKQPYPFSDFVPKWDRTQPTPEELFRKLAGINATLGGSTQ